MLNIMKIADAFWRELGGGDGKGGEKGSNMDIIT
jgi:hypothetical protein